VRNTRPLFWIFVPILLALSIGAAWGTVHFGPIGKPSQAAVECSNLQKFVANEELEGKAEWVEYRSLVDQFLALSPTSDARIPLIEEMASKVIGVLGHDLLIYKEMEKFTGCLLQSKRSEIPGLIEETESAIAFLNGSTPESAVLRSALRSSGLCTRDISPSLPRLKVPIRPYAKQNFFRD